MTRSFKTNVSVDGTLSTTGQLNVTASAGDEGGQIFLANAVSNTTIASGVNIDVYQNKLRFWEQGGTNRGYYIDITAGSAGVGTSLTGGSTGAMNYAQTEGTKQSAISSAGTTIVSVSITTNGYPVLVSVTGDVENNTAGGWVVLQLYRGATAIGNPVHAESSAGSENVPYGLSVIDAPSAGTYTYALKLNNSAGGTFNFGESDGPVITVIELSGPKGDTGAAGTANSFTTISTPSGTNPVADSSTDTLTLTAGTGITITGDATADSIAIATNAATANGASTIVLRDASGNFATNQATLVSQKFGTGTGAPSFNSYTAGVRSILYDNIGVSSAGYAIGINSGEFWHTTSDTTGSFKWYGGTTLAGTLTGTGAFTAAANVSAPQLISTVATGTAPFTVTSTTMVTNLNADLLEGYSPATANGASTIVLRDASGAFSAGAITGTSFNSITGLSSTTPAAPGTAAVGTATTAARADHVHAIPTTVVATVTGSNTTEIVRGNMADNDQFRILIGGTAGNAGYVELATADDGTEPIYVRQYTGVFQTLARTATLLDGSGNTSFPGTVTGTTFSGSGASLTSIPNSATTAASTNTANAIVARDTSGNFSAGTITASLTGTASNATNTTITNDAATATAVYPTWVTANTGNLPQKTTSGALSFVPSTGTLTATIFSGSGASLTNVPAANLTGNFNTTVLGNSTAYVGTTAIALNRGSANQALTGISSIALPGSTSGTITLQPNAVAGTTTLTLPATTGTVALTSQINDATLTVGVSGTGLSISATPTFTANQSTNRTITVTSNATDANGSSTIVARDASGNFTAGKVTAGLGVPNGSAFEYYGYSTTSGTSTLTNVPGTVGYATTPSILTSVLTTNATTNTGSVGAEFRASGTTTTHLITFSSGTTARGSISLNSTTVTYGTGSDYRLKENIQPLTGAIARLLLLKPSRFNFIEFPEKTVDGFIAHEAQEVVPESVTGEKDEINEDGSPAYQGIDQGKLVPLLTAALQESIEEVEDLKTTVSTLLSRIEALEAR